MNLPPHRSVRALIRTRREDHAACAGCGSILSGKAMTIIVIILVLFLACLNIAAYLLTKK